MERRERHITRSKRAHHYWKRHGLVTHSRRAQPEPKNKPNQQVRMQRMQVSSRSKAVSNGNKQLAWVSYSTLHSTARGHAWLDTSKLQRLIRLKKVGEGMRECTLRTSEKRQQKLDIFIQIAERKLYVLLGHKHVTQLGLFQSGNRTLIMHYCHLVVGPCQIWHHRRRSCCHVPKSIAMHLLALHHLLNSSSMNSTSSHKIDPCPACPTI
jgi:hypothetical protein